MNIAIICSHIGEKSGLRATVEFAQALKKEGHQITLYAYQQKSNPFVINRLKKSGIKITLYKSNNLISQIITLRRLVANAKHDIISCQCYLSQLFAVRFAGPPIIWTYHGTQFNALSEYYFPDIPLWVKVLDKLLNIAGWLRTILNVYLSDAIVAISKNTECELKNLFGRSPSAVISHGARPSNFPSPPENRNKVKKKIILSVSRITPYKGFHKLIKAVNQLSRKIPEIRLVIAGSSPIPRYLTYLKKIAKKTTSFRINISDTKLIELYEKAYLYTSADEYAFFAMPIWEASSFSLPTVAFDYKATSEAVIHKKSGYLVKDTHQLTYYLEKLLTNSNLRNKMGKHAKHLIKTKTWKNTALQYEKLFRKTLQNVFNTLLPENLVNEIKDDKKIQFLADLGSDEGTNLKLLKKLGYLENVIKATAIDSNISKLKILCSKNYKINAIQADITKMYNIPSNSFDFVIFNQVIEHIDNQKQAMKEITRILKPGGKLFIGSVLKKWYGLYWHKNKRGEITVHPDHVHEFKSIKEFTDLIKSSGLKVTKTEQIPGNLPIFDYFVRLINLFSGKDAQAEHRQIYFHYPFLISLHKAFSFIPLPGYSIVEAIAVKQKK